MTWVLSVRGLPHVISIGALSVLGALIFWPAFGFPPSIPPFGPDNVYALELGAYDDPTAFFTADQVWRPVTYSTLWAQYQISELDISAFFGVNIVLWLACASLVYGLVYAHTGLLFAAAAAGLITLTDERMFSPLVLIIERQSVLAAVFGILALAAAHHYARDERCGRGFLAAIVVLLFLAALSKEFGLAFAFGVAAIGLLNRRRELLVVAFGVLVAYGVGRALSGGLQFGSGVAPGEGYASGDSDKGLCETMGFGANPRDVCYGELTLPEQLAQYAWNIGASFVGIFFPPVISPEGYLRAPDVLASTLGGPDYYVGFTVASLIVPAIITVLALVACWKRPAIALPLLAVVVANAALDFQYYRPRNVVVGMVALFVAAGIGIPPAIEILKKQLHRVDARWGDRLSARLRASAPALLILLLLVGTGAAVVSRATALAGDLEGARASHETRDPCDAGEVYGFSEFQNRLKEEFGLPGRCRPQP